ncbi:MAG: lysophospholipid acyltransferase family protein [SAR324 cluster bacterium]|nr:lysophospholipid acyltransferase family protein [SAR324 cluster bacterium]
MPEPSEKVCFKHRFEYFVVHNLKKLSLSVSDAAVARIQFLIFVLLYYVFRVQRHVVDTNFRIAYPDLQEDEREKLIRANYQWSARVSVEMMRMDRWQNRTEEYVSFHGLSVLDEALSEDNGVILVSGHFGHWEMIVPSLAEKGYEMYIYVGEQSNPLVNAMHNKTRASFGAHPIERGSSARFEFMRTLKKQNVLAMLVDQNDRKTDTFVNFFGKLAAVTRSAAGFHLARKSPIVVAYCPFVGNGVEIHFERVNCEKTSDKKQDQINITQAISDVIEGFVRQYPDQYFWMHRRWRTRPAEDPVFVY